MQNAALPLLVHFAHLIPKHAKCSTAFAGAFCTPRTKTCKMLHCLCWCISHTTHHNMQNAPLPSLVHFAHHGPKHAKCSITFAGAFCTPRTTTCKMLHCLCWCILHTTDQNIQNAPLPLLVYIAYLTPKHAKCSIGFAGAFCTPRNKTCKMLHCLRWCILHTTHQNMQNASLPLLVHFAHHASKHAKCSTAFAGAFCTPRTKTCKMLHCLCWCILHTTDQNMQNAQTLQKELFAKWVCCRMALTKRSRTHEKIFFRNQLFNFFKYIPEKVK